MESWWYIPEPESNREYRVLQFYTVLLSTNAKLYGDEQYFVFFNSCFGSCFNPEYLLFMTSALYRGRCAQIQVKKEILRVCDRSKK